MSSPPPAAKPKKKDENKELVDKLKTEWKQMWAERYDDKMRAEGVSAEEYKTLKVQRGTIIHATRDYKAMDFKQVLEENKIQQPDRYIQPPKEIGGWTKFVKAEITAKNRRQQIKQDIQENKKKTNQTQPKKGGRGWMHKT